MQKQKQPLSSDKQYHPVWLGVGLAGIAVGFILTFWSPDQVRSLAPEFSERELKTSTPWWEIQAIDTMKTSRDKSREYAGNKNLSAITDAHAERIASTGATHIAIATPYDSEFLPILRTWVTSARKYNLKVWFRGNWSGWEEWFEYPAISREEHLQKTVAFLNENQELFEEGDIFQACPECENGGPGDPRYNGDKEGHVQFLIDLHQVSSEIFAKHHKFVDTRLNSMNGDVARLIMDPETTKALGGFIVVDHYVETPTQLVKDLEEYAKLSGGKVILGEFGAPIPDIHGVMTHEEQAEWLEDLYAQLVHTPAVVGMNYWTDTGSSTQLWNESGVPRVGVDVVTKYFTPKTMYGTITDPHGNALEGVTVQAPQRSTQTAPNGWYIVPYTEVAGNVTLSKPGFITKTISLEEMKTHTQPITLEYDFFTAEALASLFEKSLERVLRYLFFRQL
ncbi:MAG: carboxypeptidase-like regulatory domain-containing protein [Microgenomates group bacterium]